MKKKKSSNSWKLELNQIYSINMHLNINKYIKKKN